MAPRHRARRSDFSHVRDYIDAHRGIFWETAEPMGRYDLQDLLIGKVGAYTVDVLEMLQWASARGLYYDSFDPCGP